jgi:hypothetical protein
MSVGRLLRLDHRARVALMGTLALFIALVATAFAIGGSGSDSQSNARSAVLEPAGTAPLAGAPTNGVGVAGGITAAPPSLAVRHGVAQEKEFATTGSSGGSSAAGTVTAPAPAPQTATDSATATDASASVQATKIVKTGELTVRVDKTQVQSIVGQLSTLATSQGGYVASSSTNTGSGVPSGEVVLRIPVAHFTDAINAAEKLGHVLSLTTSADDVTGHYVDLAAREHALVQTRETYLTILGRARTIGATLEVQDRIQGVQSQIEQLQGQLKVLASQTSYSTLTVDVTPEALAAALPHHRHGLSKAWHTSWTRFGRGIDSLVGAIGPLVLALLILAVVGTALTIGYCGVRKVTS